MKEFESRWASHERITFRNLSPVKDSIHLLRGTLKDEEGHVNLYPFALSGRVVILLFEIEYVLTFTR